jgi:hypothetical protein
VLNCYPYSWGVPLKDLDSISLVISQWNYLVNDTLTIVIGGNAHFPLVIICTLLIVKIAKSINKGKLEPAPKYRRKTLTIFLKRSTLSYGKQLLILFLEDLSWCNSSYRVFFLKIVDIKIYRYFFIDLWRMGLRISSCKRSIQNSFHFDERRSYSFSST